MAKVEIRVLTVWQPFADALMLDKWVENRPRVTHYRGPLWIQAGLRRVVALDDDAQYRNVPGNRIQGHIIGRVDLLECALNDDVNAVFNYLNGFRKTLTERQQELRPFLPRANAVKWHYAKYDEYCWIVGNPRWLKTPIPCTGKLGIFRVNVNSDQLGLKR